MAEQPAYGAEQIQVLEGLEAVRKRPAMYIGTTDVLGLHHLVSEVVDNSIDEAMAGRCDQIDVVVYPDNSVSVADNGMGIPVDMHLTEGKPAVEVVMTKLHAGGKFGGEGSAYKVSGGLHGVGVSCVNALSSWCEVQVRRHDLLHRIRFERGQTAVPLEVLGAAEGTGTRTHFLPDDSIFSVTVYSWERLAERLRDLAYLNGGVKITLTDQRQVDEETGQFRSEVFHYSGGIRQFVEYLNETKDPLHQPIYIRDERDGVDVEVAMQYNEGFIENTLCFANCIHTPDGGTHLSGLRTAITRTLNQYARNQNLLKEKDRNFSGDDVREGLSAVISVRLPEPNFESQTKVRLTNPEIDGLVNSIVGDALMTHFEENPQVARQVIEKAITASRAREAARRAADLIKRKSALEVGGMPGKLWDCSSRHTDECELFIVEGDSAAGTAKAGRNSRFQAILPLGGKPLNVEKHRIDKILAHEHIRTIITAIGTGIADPNEWEEIHEQIRAVEEERRRAAREAAQAAMATQPALDLDLPPEDELDEPVEASSKKAGKRNGVTSNFDYAKLRYGKIIIMADADVDGSHIRTLLLTFLLRYLRPLVEQGHIYIAQPPLFGVKHGSHIEYVHTEKERDAVLERYSGRRGVTVQRYKGLGEMNAEQLEFTTMRPDSRTLLRISIEDAVGADHIVSVLMGDAVEPRKAYIVEHARKVRNLDI
ncbi:MAG: type IIA DNA topoisomerase subunit B [Fimbriimonadaceae bacterium]|nr:type IIA DNA topoisomerase subunit B [Fimbriimonadaceae bacterium]